MPETGNLARASAGITTPSLGSFGGDLASLAGGFLEGIQEEKERKEKQALEEARIALEEDRIKVARETLAESQRSAEVREGLSEQQIAVLDRTAAAQESQAETLASGQALRDQAAIDETNRRLATLAGNRAILKALYNTDQGVLDSLNLESSETLILENRAAATREAEIESSLALNSGQRQANFMAQVSDLSDERDLLRGERQDLFVQNQQEVADLIEKGLLLGEEFINARGDFERSLEIAIGMSAEELQGHADAGRAAALLPTVGEERADLDARLLDVEERLNEARANLNAMQETERPPGEGIVGADGSPGPGVSGVNQASEEEQEPDSGSPTAIAFAGLYAGDVTVAARNLRFAMSQQPPPPGLPDTLAWIASMGKTPEDIFAESDQAIAEAQAEEEARAAAEEEAAKGVSKHAGTARVARSTAIPGPGGPVLSRSERRKQRAEERLADNEEPEIDQDIIDLEDQVADSTRSNVMADANKVVAINVAQTKLADLSGNSDLDAAMGGYETLLGLGLSRVDILASIPDAVLREAVADRTSNRIAVR